MNIKGGGCRCDGCGRLAQGADKFKGFYMPPSINMVTKRPDGRFPGISRAGKPDELVQLHACPGCQPKILKAMNVHDFSKLPEGPLRQIVEQLVTSDRLRNMRLH